MNLMKVYQYWSPGKVIFGPNSLLELGNIIGSKDIPLIVTDKGVREAKILEKVTDVLDSAGRKYSVFDGVVPTPPMKAIEEAAVIFKNQNCTSVVGLGGGSSIDGAKSVSIKVSQEGNLREYGAGREIKGSMPPIYAIPTTAGTGSEVTASALIADDENQRKIIFRASQLAPKVAILDPLLLGTIPSKVAAETGADALTHAIEAYVSLNGNPITDAIAISAIKLIARYLRRVVANPGDMEAAGQMLIGSCMAGLSFQNAGLGLVHALANPLDVYCYHISHALLCALYLPVVMEFNTPACSEKFVSIAEAMGEDVKGFPSVRKAARQAISAVRDLFNDIGIPKTFSDIGIRFELKPEMIESILVSPAAKLNPRKTEKDQIARLFETPK
jgi:alcohol dehydrogenase